MTGQSLRRSPRWAAGSGLEVDGAIEPLGNYVLVRLDAPEEMTKGGLLLTKKEQPQGGRVVAVGPGEADPDSGALVPMLLKPGVKVMYSKYGGGSDSISLGGVEHTLVREDDVLVSYNGEEPTLQGLSLPRGKVLVKLLDAEEETESGIILSKGAQKQSTTVGEVVAVGVGEIQPNGEVLPSPVAVGDMVRFRYGDEVELDIGDHRYSTVKMSNCIAKWKGGER